MIHITVNRLDNKVTAFEMSGHANSGPYGYDLVCAAVSAVSFGSVNAVMELCQLDLGIDQGTDGGYLYVTIPNELDSKTMDKAQLIIEAMLVSLKTIELEYGQFIKIHEEVE